LLVVVVVGIQVIRTVLQEALVAALLDKTALHIQAEQVLQVKVLLGVIILQLQITAVAVAAVRVQ
jgi:hypothetical protein